MELLACEFLIQQKESEMSHDEDNRVRIALDLVEGLIREGIPFVPVPVFNEEDFETVCDIAAERMKKISDCLDDLFLRRGGMQ